MNDITQAQLTYCPTFRVCTYMNVELEMSMFIKLCSVTSLTIFFLHVYSIVNSLYTLVLSFYSNYKKTFLPRWTTPSLKLTPEVYC